MSSRRSVSIRILGKVQGVWYRASAKSEADSLHLTGFVSNMPDGSVYVEASGPADDVQKFILWCQKGPQFARVDEVHVEEIDTKSRNTFEIRR